MPTPLFCIRWLSLGTLCINKPKLTVDEEAVFSYRYLHFVGHHTCNVRAIEKGGGGGKDEIGKKERC
jgi:hypothetical protein